MNVFPPLTGRLMYYASPSDQRGWWGAGRWGVSMSDAPWHWLYKWMHLHAFHFPAHRSREELIGPSLIGDDWLQLGPPMHFDGLHIWQSLLTQWLNHARLSAWSLIVRDTNVVQQPEDSAIGCPNTTVIICLCTSWLCVRKGVLTSVVWQTDMLGKGHLLLQPFSDKNPMI